MACLQSFEELRFCSAYKILPKRSGSQLSQLSILDPSSIPSEGAAQGLLDQLKSRRVQAAACSSPVPLALWEKRNPQQYPWSSSHKLRKTSLIFTARKLTASFPSLPWLEFFRAPGADNTVHLSPYFSPLALMDNSPGFVPNSLPLSWQGGHLETSIGQPGYTCPFSVRSEKGGTQGPESLAGGLSQLPPHTLSPHRGAGVRAVWTQGGSGEWLSIWYEFITGCWLGGGRKQVEGPVSV